MLSLPLNRRLVRNWRDCLGLAQLDCSRLPRLDWQPLDLNLVAGRLGLLLCGGVGLDATYEIFARAALADVFEADVDALLDVAVADSSVEDDANGGLGNVVDDTGLAVVDLVGHTLLHGSVGDYVDNASDFVLLEVGGERDASGLLEAPGEGITSTCTKTC